MMDNKDKPMNITRHLQARMSQRAISISELDVTLAFGELKGDKVVLNKKRVKELLAEFEYINTNQLERAK